MKKLVVTINDLAHVTAKIQLFSRGYSLLREGKVVRYAVLFQNQKKEIIFFGKPRAHKEIYAEIKSVTNLDGQLLATRLSVNHQLLAQDSDFSQKIRRKASAAKAMHAYELIELIEKREKQRNYR